MLVDIGVDGLRSENAAQDVAPTIIAVAVALVPIPGVLRVALVVALHKTLTKCLRRGVLEVARSLRIVILSALTITRARVQALLVATVDFILIISTVIAVAAISAIPSVVVDLTVVAVDLTIAAVHLIIIPTAVLIVRAIVAASMPVPIPVLIVALTTLIIAVAILGLSGAGGRSKYSQNKCERQKSPANPFSKFFHVRKSPLPGDTIGKLYAFAPPFKIVGFAGLVTPCAY
jgi:hypothetical protein